MNLLDTLIASAQGGALQHAAESQGIAADAVPDLLKNLVPTLQAGMQRNTQNQNGLEGLVKALASGNHGRYLDDVSALSHPDAVKDGNGILGHLLGNKDVSRGLASRAATNTGLDVSAIKRFLPLVAAAAMGAMSQKTGSGTSLTGQQASSGLGSLLGGFLDADDDGSVVDDLFSLGKKLLG